MNNLENGALKKLKDRLYKRGEVFIDRRNQTEMPHEIENVSVPTFWPEIRAPQNKGVMKKIVIFLFIFTVLAVASLVYFIFWGGNIISSRNIKMEIKGAPYADSGKAQSITFYVENQNKSVLETANLILEYPEGVVSMEGEQLKREIITLGEIKPNQSVNKIKDFILLGMENEEKQIKAVLEYRLADSSAIFTKKKDYSVKISKPAVGLSVSLPSQIHSRQEVEIKIEAVSNSDSNLKNLSLQAVYPSGFKFIQSEPKPVSGENTWLLGDIQPLQKREIILRGIIEGQDMDEKTFNAALGVMGEDGIFRVYGEGSGSLVVKKSPFNFTIFINGQDKEFESVNLRDSVRVSLQWNNQMPENIRDARVELEITGNAHKEDSIFASQGFYSTSEKKVIWNSSSAELLRNINSGQSGEVQCGFSAIDALPISGVNDKNFSILLKAKISGIANIAGAEGAEFIEETAKEIKVVSEISAQNGIFYNSGPFKNIGPLPPKPGQETTYTVVWSLGGNSSDVSSVKLSAFLPPYVRWLGEISPSGSKISYNERDGSVVWDVGFINAGSGVVLPRKEVAFKIGFTPNPGQEGSSPTLVEKGSLEGHNNFTGGNFQKEISALNIVLSGDSGYKPEYGRVAE